MLLGSILLALAWAALQGEITLVNLIVGYGLGYIIIALLAKGGVMPSTLASRTAHAIDASASSTRSTSPRRTSRASHSSA